MEVDDTNSGSGLQSKPRKPEPPVKVQYLKFYNTILWSEIYTQPTQKISGRPSKKNLKSRTDPIPDDQTNVAASQFLQPVTPPRKVGQKDTSSNQYSPQTAQAVQFSMQPSIWQIPVAEEPTRRPRHATTESSEARPLNKVNRNKGTGWKCLGKTGTAVLYKLFQVWVMFLFSTI